MKALTYVNICIITRILQIFGELSGRLEKQEPGFSFDPPTFY